MKKVIYTGLIIFIGIFFFASCKKNYHCQCTYNNTVVYTEDMGSETSDKAKKRCSVYDSTGIPGEVWLCTTY
jgi:hypothetical protein